MDKPSSGTGHRNTSAEFGLKERDSAAEAFRDAPRQTDLESFGQFELPIILLELTTFTVVAITEAARGRLGLPVDEIVGRPATALLRPEDRSAATLALEALGDGAIDFYRAHRTLVEGGDAGRPFTAWARAIEFNERRHAFVQLAFDNAGRSPLAQLFGREPELMAVGAVNSNWVITAISCDIKQLLGVPSAAMVGQRPARSGQRARREAIARGRPHAQPRVLSGPVDSVERRRRGMATPRLRSRLPRGAGTGAASSFFQTLNCPRLSLRSASSSSSNTFGGYAAEVGASGILEQYRASARPGADSTTRRADNPPMGSLDSFDAWSSGPDDRC